MGKIYLLEDSGYSDFIPADVGHELCESGHSFGPYIRKYYLVHFVINGGGTLVNERGTHRIRGGEAFLIRPGEVTAYKADTNTPWEYMWLGFNGNLASAFDNVQDVFEYDASILTEISYAINCNECRETLLVSAIFKLYASIIGGKLLTDYSSKVKNYINLHYMEKVSISAVADSLGLNRKYLARIFKDKIGVSMQEYLIKKRLHEAVRLLKMGYNVEETAYMVGYSDQFGFSKAFKHKYGVPPSKYFEPSENRR
jgi:AraC-like DNA-binding protein